MRVPQIENWALGVIERVENGQPNEDARVELKAAWPEPVRARGQRHQDAPMSDRERSVWTVIWWILGLGVFAMIVYMLLH